MHKSHSSCSVQSLRDILLRLYACIAALLEELATLRRCPKKAGRQVGGGVGRDDDPHLTYAMTLENLPSFLMVATTTSPLPSSRWWTMVNFLAVRLPYI
jgi:hypothetical protein